LTYRELANLRTSQNWSNNAYIGQAQRLVPDVLAARLD